MVIKEINKNLRDQRDPRETRTAKEQTIMNQQSKGKYIFKAILFCSVFITLLILLSFTKSFFSFRAERLVHGIIGTIAAFAATFFFLQLDKRSFTDIGLRFENNTLLRFLIGIALGILIMGTMALSVIWFSGFTIESNPQGNLLNFLLLLLPLIPLAFMEELAFRAYPLIVLNEKTGTRAAILITALLFGLYHIANGWTLQNALLGAGVWGITYGLAATWSKGIALPTGMHYAANLTTAAFSVSANSLSLFIIKSKSGTSLENYQGSDLATLLPQLGLLIAGVVAMEIYIRMKRIQA